MAIPDAVRTTVLRRMQRLDDTERAVLARAAVIGRRFDLRVLVATGASSSERVVAALERALALQLVEPDGSTPGRYSFRHALTRDIVYEEFLSGRVRPLHRRIAAELERMLREGDVALEDLAFHAWSAGDTRRGLRYNELAGDRALAQHAPDDARAYYARALSLVDLASPDYVRLTSKLRAAGG